MDFVEEKDRVQERERERERERGWTKGSIKTVS
jgi:hypothetical protein